MFRLIFAFIILMATTFRASAHCQVPCGIYGDSLQVALLYEDIETIEKSMTSIINISSESGDKDYNQLVRWVNNKEMHADKIQRVVADYFLTQRLKLTEPKDKEAYKLYTEQLTLLHKLQVYAMKAKQTTQLSYIKLMRETLHEFEHLYFKK